MIILLLSQSFVKILKVYAEDFKFYKINLCNCYKKLFKETNIIAGIARKRRKKEWKIKKTGSFFQTIWAPPNRRPVTLYGLGWSMSWTNLL